MMRTIYIGFVIDKETNKVMPVSVSRVKQEAGELTEQWINEWDLGGVDYKFGGIWTVQDADYIRV